MGMTKLKSSTALVVLAVGLAGWGLFASPVAQAQEPNKTLPRQASKLDLTPETLVMLHALIRPHDQEWRHLKVQWLTDVVAARKKAAAEDKPIIICYTGGAGYNEPLGVC